jgi:hypothetical protein
MSRGVYICWELGVHFDTRFLSFVAPAEVCIVYIARVILSSCNPSLFSPSRIYMGHWACTQRDWESYKRKYCAVILKKRVYIVTPTNAVNVCGWSLYRRPIHSSVQGQMSAPHFDLSTFLLFQLFIKISTLGRGL